MNVFVHRTSILNIVFIGKGFSTIIESEGIFKSRRDENLNRENYRFYNAK